MSSKLKDAISALDKSVEAAGKNLEAAAQTQKGADAARAGLPFGIRKGEDPNTSRGFSYLKAIGLAAGRVKLENAQVEADLLQKLQKYYDGWGFRKSHVNSVFLPLCSDFLEGDELLKNEARELVHAGNPGRAVLTEARNKMAALGMTKALSWIDESVGGTLVAPPQYGELIEVLRNNAVLMAAGAKVYPMPPQGRLQLPRQTSPTTAYHVGESQTITDSTPGTDDLVLQAKKLTVLTKIPNELFHFAAIPIEAFIREDIGKVVALKMDNQLLEGVGSTTAPKGLINYGQINTYTSIGTPADNNSGYPIQPEDPVNMIGTVEEQNAVFKAFIMRPLLWATITNRRADSVTAGDGKGPFLFNILRDWSLDVNVDRLRVGNLNGYPVYKTTNISKARTRGTGTTSNTYVLGGDFNDYVIAMGGAMEFQVSVQGDTPFTQDQTWLRGTMYYDAAPRHEASFVLMDNVLQNK